MKLYLLTQTARSGYDTYDSAVVCAENEFQAKCVKVGDEYTWASEPAQVHAAYIGEASDRLPGGVVLASFNAG